MKIVFAMLGLSILLNAQMQIITAKDNNLTKIDEKQLSNIYLKKQVVLNDKSIEPIDNNDDYNEFYKKVIKKTPEQIHAYWMKEIFTGKKRPPKRVNSYELQEELEETENSISYSTKKLDAKVLNEIK